MNPWLYVTAYLVPIMIVLALHRLNKRGGR